MAPFTHASGEWFEGVKTLEESAPDDIGIVAVADCERILGLGDLGRRNGEFYNIALAVALGITDVPGLRVRRTGAYIVQRGQSHEKLTPDEIPDRVTAGIWHPVYPELKKLNLR